MLVMTTNLGGENAGKSGLGFGRTAEDSVIVSLREHFPPEFLGRIDCVAVFKPLDAPALTQIAQKELCALTERAARQQLAFSYAPDLPEVLAKRALGKKSGARALRSLIQSELEAPMAANLLSEHPTSAVTAQVSDGNIILC